MDGGAGDRPSPGRWCVWQALEAGWRSSTRHGACWWCGSILSHCLPSCLWGGRAGFSSIPHPLLTTVLLLAIRWVRWPKGRGRFRPFQGCPMRCSQWTGDIAHAALGLPVAVLGLGPQRCWLPGAASRGFAATILCPSPCTGSRGPQHEVVTVPQRFCCPAQAAVVHLWPAPGHRVCCTLNVSVFRLCSLWEQHLYPWTGNLAQFGYRQWLFFFFLSPVTSCSRLYWLVPSCRSFLMAVNSSLWDFIQL